MLGKPQFKKVGVIVRSCDICHDLGLNNVLDTTDKDNKQSLVIRCRRCTPDNIIEVEE